MRELSIQSRDPRADALFDEYLVGVQTKIDRIFAWLFVSQWAFVLVTAMVISPIAWDERESSLHIHVFAAIFLGAAIISMPLILIGFFARRDVTRYVVAAAQVMFSSLIIHLMGGRIEAHFHIFGSLAILSFYRDAKVFIPAVGLVCIDHAVRGMYWPDSVFGANVVASWRTLEHAGWVAFETGFLIWGISQSRNHLRLLAASQISLSDEKSTLEIKVKERVSDLQRQHKFLHQLIDNIPCAVHWKSCDLRIDGGNQSFLKAVGAKSAKEVVGKCAEDLLDFEDHGSINSEIDRQVLESGTADIRREVKITYADGIEHTVLSSKVPLFDDRNQVNGLLEILADMTEHKALESQLVQSQKLESIGQLAAGIAHEINTPMQCVSGNVEYLKNCCERLFAIVDGYHAMLFVDQAMTLNVRREKMTRLIEECRFEHVRAQAPAAIAEAAEASQRVIEIVRAMKAMSHPGTTTKVSTDINSLVRNAAMISKGRWKYAAELVVELQDPLVDVKALPAELSQVLLNLIVNAADAIATKNGEDSGVLGLITICTQVQDNGVRIDVQDNGTGIPENVKQRVFDPFFTTKDVGRGTGQGLAITYDVVVNKHAGRISLATEIGVGTTFSVWLPCEPCAAERELIATT